MAAQMSPLYYTPEYAARMHVSSNNFPLNGDISVYASLLAYASLWPIIIFDRPLACWLFVSDKM